METYLLVVGVRIRHKLYPQLVGTIANVVEDERRPYTIQWDEPWLAGTLIDNPFRMIFLTHDEVEVLARKEQPLLKNHDCEYCQGKGYRNNLLCAGCSGTGKVRYY